MTVPDRKHTLRRRTLLNACLVAGGGAVALTGSVDAQPEEVTECTTLDAPGEYQLATDLSGTGDCITVAADNVVLDGDGHAMAGQEDGAGIHVVGNNVTIRDLTISGFETGITVSESDDVALTNIEVVSNGGGIVARLGSNLSIADSEIAENEGHGIFYHLWDGLSIDSSEIRLNQGTGIETDEGWDLELLDSTVSGNEDGISVSPGDEVRGTEVTDQSGFGISLDPFPQPPFQRDVAILENTIVGNNGAGVSVFLGHARLEQNTVSDNEHGLYLERRYEEGDEWDATAELANNTVTGNAVAGITNTTEISVDATCNWWGDADGPIHPNSPQDDPNGDEIDGPASFVPWLTKAGGPCDGGVVGLEVTITDVPDAVTVGDTIPVVYRVSNVDDVDHEQQIVLRVAGEDADSTSVSLAPGESHENEFSYETSDEDVPEVQISVVSDDDEAVTHVAVNEADEPAEVDDDADADDEPDDDPDPTDDADDDPDPADETDEDPPAPDDDTDEPPADDMDDTNADPANDDDIIPGFGVLGSVLGLGGAGYVIRRWQSDSD